MGTGVLKTMKKAGSEKFLDRASGISDAPETSPSRRRRIHPENLVLSCLDALPEELCKPQASDRQAAPASSLGPLSLSVQDLEAISWSDLRHTDPLMRFSMPPLWAALADRHDSLGLHN